MSRLLIIVALLLAIASGTAAAQGPGRLAPPGNSAVDEYTEVVPTDAGGRPASGLVAAKPGKPLSGRTARALRAQGADGRAVAALVVATGPERARTTPGAGAGHHGVPALRPGAPGGSAKDPGRGPLSSIVATLTDGSGGSSGGLGLLFPLLLAAALVAVLAMRFARRRSAD